MKTLEEMKDQYILHVLSIHGFHRTKAASTLGITARSLRNMICRMKSNGVVVKDSYFSIASHNKLASLENRQSPDDWEVPEGTFPTNEERIHYIDTLTECVR